ncbi:hypothetical protein TL16_g05116 [Triparma laevis f. inornata]|uniref:Uncharacterized protein n=1 Tax=Triparma laevis f. inornata TaxID=1714386 RepID=A0A9W7AG22_9STRA|nr:hypothetical protein TL16_g05116 [Triparma laevis f. inornata]
MVSVTVSNSYVTARNSLLTLFDRSPLAQVPIGVNLIEEQINMLKDAGGERYMDIPTGIMNQQTQADVIDEQFQNWSSKNLVDGRMAWARLRTQSHKNSSIETILQTLQNQKKEKETTNQPQWPGGEGEK